MSSMKSPARATRPKVVAIADELRKSLFGDGCPRADRWSALDRLIDVARRWKSSAKSARDAAAKHVQKLLGAAATTAGLTTRRLQADEAKSLASLLAEPFAKPYRQAAAELWGLRLKGGDKPKKYGQLWKSAAACVLRRDWSPNGAALGVEFGADGDALRLNLGGALVAAGPWRTTIRQSDRELHPTEDWSAACWFADSDGEYLELNRMLTHGVAHVRQIFVARHVPWVLLADSARGGETSDWSLAWEVPTVAATGLQGLVGSRGQRVLGSASEILAAPLSSPMDPMRPGPDRLSIRDGKLRLEHRATGKRTLAALAFTWGADVAASPNWRVLTVTNDRTLCTPEDALAVRMSAGGKQCVFFHSLDNPVRRAFLGHQTFDETILGVFNAKGDVDPWLRVE